MAADDRHQTGLARLTLKEKECLRRFLSGQTAKEIANDLGITVHAVEKRLRMAREKLGVSSSLAAARLVAAAEGWTASSHWRELAVGHADGGVGLIAIAPSLTRRRAGISSRETAALIAAAALLVLSSRSVTPPSCGMTIDDHGRVVPMPRGGLDHADVYPYETPHGRVAPPRSDLAPPQNSTKYSPERHAIRHRLASGLR